MPRKLLFTALVLLLALILWMPSCPDRQGPLREPGTPAPEDTEARIGAAPELAPVLITGTGQAGSDVQEDPDAVIDITLRDLADGTPATGVTVIGSADGTKGGQPGPRTSDSSGVIRVPRSWVGSPRSPDGDWVIPRQSRETILKTGEIWCHTWLEITGNVDTIGQRTDSTFPARVTLKCWPRQSLGRPGKEGRDLLFLKRRGVRTDAGQCMTDEGGTFHFKAPRIKGLLLCASGGDGGSVTKRVEVDSFHSRVDVRLTLRRPITVTGRLIGKDGRPLRNAKVTLFSEMTVETSELDLEALNAAGTGVCATGNTATGILRVWVKKSAKTDEEGRFSIAVHLEGRGLLVACQPGHAPIREELGGLRRGSRDIGDVHGVGAESTGRISFTVGGRSIGSCSMMVIDVSSTVGQPIIPCSSPDQNGSVSAEWFERGREYYILLSGKDLPDGAIRGFLTWSGEDKVDLETDLHGVEPALRPR